MISMTIRDVSNTAHEGCIGKQFSRPCKNYVRAASIMHSTHSMYSTHSPDPVWLKILLHIVRYSAASDIQSAAGAARSLWAQQQYSAAQSATGAARSLLAQQQHSAARPIHQATKSWGPQPVLSLLLLLFAKLSFTLGFQRGIKVLDKNSCQQQRCGRGQG